MIKKELLEIINKIDINLQNYFADLEQTEKEIVLSRNLKLIEEVWELSSDILEKFYKRRNTTFDENNLKWEFADVIITTLLLAKTMNIDINDAIEMKLKKIEDRGGI